MKSPQVVYNVDRAQFIAKSDDPEHAHLDTFFVFPPDLKEGDKLPSLLFYAFPKEKKAFQFDGQYNPDSDNLEVSFLC